MLWRDGGGNFDVSQKPAEPFWVQIMGFGCLGIIFAVFPR